MKKLFILLLICLMYSTSWACEFGKTYMDYNLNGTDGKATKEEIVICEKTGDAFYVKDEWHWERVYFKDGRIGLFTGYTWCGMENPPPKGKEPYILYKGHRWYPQYHGIIYVYQDGKERK